MTAEELGEAPDSDSSAVAADFRAGRSSSCGPLPPPAARLPHAASRLSKPDAGHAADLQHACRDAPRGHLHERRSPGRYVEAVSCTQQEVQHRILGGVLSAQRLPQCRA